MKLAIAIALLQTVANASVETPAPSLLRALPAGAVLTPDDLSGDGAAIARLAGRQTRRYMPAGAAVHPVDVRKPVVISRNALVRLRFEKGPLSITAEGRALSDGAAGESVRVMALRSKAIVTGVVAEAGIVDVQ